uniref:Uncharacterized protein n=1 Tax=Amphiprion percula TaxID=161767 RepID=A0A3P8S7B0_AMPPE
MQTPCRQIPGRDANWGSSSCEVTVLTTEQLCSPGYFMYRLIILLVIKSNSTSFVMTYVKVKLAPVFHGSSVVHFLAGNWGSWLPWSPCSETCGKGMQSRIRLCNNPPPAFDGPQCEGTDTQTQVCKERPCPVDGKWLSWVSWGACSVSCGGGTRQRTRLCASPTPQHGGRQCEGDSTQLSRCNTQACPGKACHKSAVSVCGSLYTCEQTPPPCRHQIWLLIGGLSCQSQTPPSRSQRQIQKNCVKTSSVRTVRHVPAF